MLGKTYGVAITDVIKVESVRDFPSFGYWNKVTFKLTSGEHAIWYIPATVNPRTFIGESSDTCEALKDKTQAGTEAPDPVKFWDNLFDFLGNSKGQSINNIKIELKEEGIDVDKIIAKVKALIKTRRKELNGEKERDDIKRDNIIGKLAAD